MATARGHWDQPPGWNSDPEDTADGAPAPGADFGEDARFVDPEDLPERPVRRSVVDAFFLDDAEDAAFDDTARPRVEEYLAL
ncbi:hypothetical protein [Cryptosporangium aurantiacum]|uniref:Uncharacterized protein n=1 Tax=Cryptosporangium aurantiacum TaxID=134849 RepID=A0A1M7TZ03_9ACTN|nr:hypothetical protein [Cryptosporangium aurantiacum]SHN75917.1 hypothetical protein SAMN05443668_107414 [Cryptosporangium aurantiacum]